MQALLAEINRARAQPRLCGSESMPAAPALRWSAPLASAAAVHSADMAAHNFFDHRGSDGSTLTTRVAQVGYSWSGLAENIAAGNATARSTVQQWLGSASHCRSMMRASYTDMGGACYANPRATYRYYWTLVLGTPR